MQLLTHVANAMQRAEGVVLERALVLSCVASCSEKFIFARWISNLTRVSINFVCFPIPHYSLVPWPYNEGEGIGGKAGYSLHACACAIIIQTSNNLAILTH